MLRGEVWQCRLEPAEGTEIRKNRPAVVVSVDRVNARLRRVQVVPLTTGGGPLHRNEALTPSLAPPGRTSRAQAHQIRTLDRGRLLYQVGRVTADELTAIEEALRWQLGL